MYTEYYHFSEKPFEDNPDLRFLYLSPSNREILTAILTWIHEGYGFAVITGEAGIGKTFFIHALLNHLGEKIYPILVFNPAITFRDLLKEILLELKQPIRERSKTALSHQVKELFNQMKTQDKLLLIVLDETQDLSNQILQEIERFFDLKLDPVRIIFVGQLHFDERLESMELRKFGQKIKIKQKIKPFNGEESREYIDHRFRLVGGSSNLITPKALSMICSYSQGIPSMINHVCDNALRLGYTLNREKIDVGMIEKVIQNLDGPKISKKPLHTFPFLKQIWKFPLLFLLSSKRVSIIVLLLLCLGGLIFLFYDSYGKGSPILQEIKSFIREKLVASPSFHKQTVQGTIEGILRKDRIQTSEKLKIYPFESSSPQTKDLLFKPGKEKQQLAQIIIAKRGDTLSLLAKNYYAITNTTLIDHILQSNPEITNADLIKVDQKIRIPEITEESLIHPSSDQTFKIHVGTFWSSELPKRYREESALKGKSIEVIPLKVSPTETWYRVLIGNFQNREEALKMIFLLKKKGLLPSFERR